LTLDFDNIEDWAPKLTAALRPHVSNYIEQKLLEAAPEYEYIEDTQDMLFHLTDRDAVIDAVVAWLRSSKIAGYHGSRLTDSEVHSIQVNGLIPLEPETRRDRLTRALSPNSRWPKVAPQLDAAIQAYGQGSRAGRREGQVHLTLSRAGLTQGFNHYLTYGSEFDQHVAQKLLGTEGMELLASYGEPRVFKVAVPGALALDAANRYFTVDDFRDRGEIPNLVSEFLKSWVHRLVCPSFQSNTLKVDCGIVFHQTIPAAWITGFDTLSEAYNRNSLSTNEA
jgi:hypothetical protein